MAKIPEAQARLYKNVFVCKKCKSKVRAPNIKILQGKIKCKRCNSKSFRAVRKK
ncbi:MAG: hypothetical protein KKA79_09485 [Nanoarchaeota archaeon]|nr:hypothetical protein [Nanoarchaeota archaeon]MCG2718516.1 hypothetical protein [Nanoarchaeota archaeon]